MNQEDRNAMQEFNELILENYRELAARIAKNSLDAGFTIPQQSAESAYNAQVQVASLGVLILERIIPALDVAGLLKDRTELMYLLQRSLSKAATASGLPACHYHQSPGPEGESS